MRVNLAWLGIARGHRRIEDFLPIIGTVDVA